jgi:DNA-binding NtrC family response regulator
MDRCAIWFREAVLSIRRAESDVTAENGGKVLVVDDDPLQRGEIVEFLSRCGFDVISEENGFAAYHQIKKLRPRVIVLDLKLPGIDGVHLSRLVSAMDYEPRVILMSGYPEFMYKAQRDDTSVFAILEKPLPLGILGQFVTEAFDQGEG